MLLAIKNINLQSVDGKIIFLKTKINVKKVKSAFGDSAIKSLVT